MEGFSHCISLDQETEALLQARASQDGDGVSAAIRSFIRESVDPALRLRKKQRAHLRAAGTTLAAVKLVVPEPVGRLVDQVTDRLDTMEHEMMKVTTT